MPAGEVSTHDIVVHAINQGKTVFVPYIHGSRQNGSQKPTRIMDMLALHSQEDLESLRRDPWGIPTLDESSVPARENALSGHGVENILTRDDGAPKRSDAAGLDLVLVPGVAFDTENRRLGHGKGFYDRYLQRYKDIVSSGSNAPMPRLGKKWSAFRQRVANCGPIVGLALKEQMLPKGAAIPSGSDDWLMDQVITGA
jgi:5-formyltetrahydrofolate cyclo-ligase